jgi:hypothetical protein
VARTEAAVARRYKRETYKHDEQETVRQALRAYVEDKAQVARRAMARHQRRVRELTDQQQKLVQLYDNGGVSEEVLKAEQKRIAAETAKAQRWAEAAQAEITDVLGALEGALLVLDETVRYEQLPPSSRRMVNQAVFVCLIVIDPDTIHAERTRFYVGQLRAAHPAIPAARHPKTAAYADDGPQDDHDPEKTGPGFVHQANGGLHGTTVETQPRLGSHTGAARPALRPKLGCMRKRAIERAWRSESGHVPINYEAEVRTVRDRNHGARV